MAFRKEGVALVEAKAQGEAGDSYCGD